MLRTFVPSLLVTLGVILGAEAARAQAPVSLPDTTRGGRMLEAYFRAETERLARGCLADIKAAADWQARSGEYRRQLREMLGLDPLPPRTPLEPVVTGRLEHERFTVENLHFQSSPGLYVTGNLYLPKGLQGPAPAVLYVCGHGQVKIDGVSYGNKTHYQHHGAWFAEHGFVCLVIDTLQLGEIEGLHHGTYREGMWWWICRGYTPAGVEAWNCIRALDYLETRPEVDPKRFGVSGRSGGGAYSWWIATIDERIGCAVPVAGITDLENHVVDGVVEGHCDCMYMANTYRWDYGQVAALVAPRPLLIANTDRDRIFPLEGVVRIHRQVRDVYRLLGAETKFGLQISEGPHEDTQELQVAAFHWMQRHLTGQEPLIERAAQSYFTPQQLKVFRELPADQINTRIQETFVPAAPPAAVPADSVAWAAERDAWRKQLAAQALRGWPSDDEPLDVRQAWAAQADGLRLAAWDYTSQGPVRLRLFVLSRAGSDAAAAPRPEGLTLRVLDDAGWQAFLSRARVAFAESFKDETLPEADAAGWQAWAKEVRERPVALAFLAPRGLGPTAFDPSARKQVQVRRRFMLLGQSLDGMQAYDVRRGVRALGEAPSLAGVPITLAGRGHTAGLALYAALDGPKLAGLELDDLSASHREGPILPNVLKVWDVPQAVAVAAERTPTVLRAKSAEPWAYPADVARQLGWPAGQFRLVTE